MFKPRNKFNLKNIKIRNQIQKIKKHNKMRKKQMNNNKIF